MHGDDPDGDGDGTSATGDRVVPTVILDFFSSCPPISNPINWKN